MRELCGQARRAWWRPSSTLVGDASGDARKGHVNLAFRWKPNLRGNWAGDPDHPWWEAAEDVKQWIPGDGRRCNGGWWRVTIKTESSRRFGGVAVGRLRLDVREVSKQSCGRGNRGCERQRQLGLLS